MLHGYRGFLHSASSHGTPFQGQSTEPVLEIVTAFNTVAGEALATCRRHSSSMGHDQTVGARASTKLASWVLKLPPKTNMGIHFGVSLTNSRLTERTRETVANPMGCAAVDPLIVSNHLHSKSHGPNKETTRATYGVSYRTRETNPCPMQRR